MGFFFTDSGSLSGCWNDIIILFKFYPKLRQAFAISIDRATLAKTVLNGRAYPLAKYWPDNTAIGKAMKDIPYDVKKAQKLLSKGANQLFWGMGFSGKIKKATYDIQVGPQKKAAGLSRWRIGLPDRLHRLGGSPAGRRNSPAKKERLAPRIQAFFRRLARQGKIQREIKKALSWSFQVSA
ncbi:MAG: hypothetical protein K6U80_08260 [Firmicutes bacterium]|nr:hypothetical protein [Bacillota bacterium]